jgi:hypothetical protein
MTTTWAQFGPLGNCITLTVQPVTDCARALDEEAKDLPAALLDGASALDDPVSVFELLRGR